MRNKSFILTILILSIFLIQLASADVWVSPKEPIINGNNYVFITYNDSTLNDTAVLMNITDPDSSLKQECDIILNEYGFGRCKYNFTSTDSSGTWGYAINTSVSGNFEVGKVNLEVTDINSLTSIKFGDATNIRVNLTYENLMPRGIEITQQGRDLGTHRGTLFWEDVDNDGKEEFVIPEYSGRLFLINYTDIIEGFDLQFRSSDVGTFYLMSGCDLGDFDGDGRKTIICSDYAGAQLEAWVDPTVADYVSDTSPDFTTADNGDNVRSPPTICDVTGDGIADQVAYGVYQGIVIIYNFTDDGGFEEVYRSGDLGTIHYGVRQLCDDFDGDGLNEWLIGVYETGYTFADVDVDNGLAITVGDAAPDHGAYYGTANTVDFDGDGVIEALVPNTGARIQTLEFNKSGTDLLEDDITWAHSSETDYGSFAYGGGRINIGDVNLNGRPDFVISDYTDGVDVLFYEYDPVTGGYDQRQIDKQKGTTYSGNMYVDFDGDGIDEILTTQAYSGNTYIYQFNGGGWDLIYEGWKKGTSEEGATGDGILYAAQHTSAYLYTYDSCAVGDFDNDTREEALCLPDNGRMFLYELEDRAESNVTPEIYLDFDTNAGFYEDLGKYTDIRLTADNEMICMRKNVALGVTDIFDEDGQDQGSISTIWTDGEISHDEWYTGTQLSGTDYVSIDSSAVEEAIWSGIKLPQSYSVGKIKTYHYYGDGRSYYDVIIRTTNDSTGDTCNWTENVSVFDNSADGNNNRYTEARFGKTIYSSPHDTICVRDSTAGSDYWTTNHNTANHRTEIEIYETDLTCNYRVSLRRSNDAVLNVKEDFIINITARDRTSNLFNVTASLNIPVTYSSLPFSLAIVGGTEYYPGQEGQIVTQLKDEFNDPVTGATCTVDYYYPNSTLWLDDQATSELSGVGVYSDSFTVSSVEGVYTAVANCISGTFSDIDSHTFHVSGILIEINNTLTNVSQLATYINQTITNTIIPYLSEINSTTHTSYSYLTDTIFPLVNETNSTINNVLNKWGTYNASQLYNISNATYIQTGNIYTDTQSLVTKWGTYTAAQLYNISNETYNKAGEIYSDMATASSLSSMQTDVTWLVSNVATQTNMTTIFNRLTEINSTVNSIKTQTDCSNESLSNASNSDYALCSYLYSVNSTINTVYSEMATQQNISAILSDTTWLVSNVATQENMTETFSRLTTINNTINSISSDLTSINSSLQNKIDLIQTDVDWLESNVATNTNITEILTRLTELNTTTNEIDDYLDNDITNKLTEINTTTQNNYDYLQNTVYTKLNETYNNTQQTLIYIGNPNDDESQNTLFGEHQYTQNRLSEIQGNLTELNTITSQINTTLYQVNSTVSTILTEVDDLEELHQCSISPNSTICTLLNDIKTDTTNIYSSVQSLSSGSLFEITGLVSGSPKYANENALIEATFAGSNGSAITPDTINLTIYDPNNNVWDSAIKSDFTQGSDNVWKYTKSIASSPTTGMYTAHLEGNYLNVSNSRIVQFRIATGGPYKVYLDCPASLAVGNELECSVILQDEGESATESTSTVWVDTDNDGAAGAGEPQMSFSKQTVAFQNVTESISINVPSSHSGGLYVVRIDTSYANSAQPNSGASDSVTLTSTSSGDTTGRDTGGSSGGGGSVTGRTIIYPEHLMDISTRILDEYKHINPGGKILMELSLYNLGTEEIKDAKIRYCIETVNKEIVKCSEEVVVVYTRIQLVKEFLISKSIISGEYYIKTEATYGNETVYSETTFEVIEEEKSTAVPKSEFLNFKINKSYLIIGIISLASVILLIFIIIILFKRKNKHQKIAVIDSKLQHLKELKSRNEISKSSYHSEKGKLLSRMNTLLKSKHLGLIASIFGLVTFSLIMLKPNLTGGVIGVGRNAGGFNFGAISWWFILGTLAVLSLIGMFIVLIYILKEIKTLTRGKAKFVSDSNLNNNLLNTEKSIKQINKNLNTNCSTESLNEIVNKKVLTDSGHYLGEVSEVILGENRIDSLRIILDKYQKFGVKGIIVKYRNVKSVGHVVVIDKIVLNKINSLKN